MPDSPCKSPDCPEERDRDSSLGKATRAGRVSRRRLTITLFFVCFLAAGVFRAGFFFAGVFVDFLLETALFFACFFVAAFFLLEVFLEVDLAGFLLVFFLAAMGEVYHQREREV